MTPTSYRPKKKTAPETANLDSPLGDSGFFSKSVYRTKNEKSKDQNKIYFSELTEEEISKIDEELREKLSNKFSAINQQLTKRYDEKRDKKIQLLKNKYQQQIDEMEKVAKLREKYNELQFQIENLKREEEQKINDISSEQERLLQASFDDNKEIEELERLLQIKKNEYGILEDKVSLLSSSESTNSNLTERIQQENSFIKFLTSQINEKLPDLESILKHYGKEPSFHLDNAEEIQSNHNLNEEHLQQIDSFLHRLKQQCDSISQA